MVKAGKKVKKSAKIIIGYQGIIYDHDNDFLLVCCTAEDKIIKVSPTGTFLLSFYSYPFLMNVYYF